MPERIQLSRRKGWRMPENTVSVARPGLWGNPFVVGVDGTRAECLYLYRMLLGGLVAVTAKAPVPRQEAARAHVVAHIETLRGKNLACWCRPGAACHGDLLLRLANQRRRPSVLGARP